MKSLTILVLAVIFFGGCQSKTAEFWLEMARQEKKLDKKIEYFNKSIAIDGENPWALNDRGQVFLRQEKYQEAIRDFRKVVDIDPNFIDGYNNIALVFEKGEDYVNALKYFDLAIKKKSDRELYYANRGLVYDKLKEYDKALEDYKKALLINPNYHHALYNRGIVYRKIREHELAILDFEKILRLNPNEKMVVDQLAGAKRDAANLDPALSASKKGGKKYLEGSLTLKEMQRRSGKETLTPEDVKRLLKEEVYKDQ